MKIDKPGFYQSKAGKCEVVAIKDGLRAIGWIGEVGFGCWLANGKFVSYGLYPTDEYDITGPYIDPPKPIEAWAVHTIAWVCPEYFADETTAKHRKGSIDPKYQPRLVHLREVTEEG